MSTRFYLFAFFIAIVFPNYASTIDSVLVESKSMNKKVKVVVVKPNSYPEGKQYRVLYLLHGFGNDQNYWLNKPVKDSTVSSLSDRYNMIIVCPDGGGGSFYIDSPIKPEIRYETFISKELIDFVDKKYKTDASKRGRVITGASMGGHGAFYLTIKHPETYLAAGSIAGAFDLTTLNFEQTTKSFKNLLGDGPDYLEKLRNISVVSLTSRLKSSGLPIIFDCGIDDVLYDNNIKYHQLLKKEGIPHDFMERPGDHSWEYFSDALEYQVLFFQKQFNKILR